MSKSVFVTALRDGDPALLRIELAGASEQELKAFEQFVLRERAQAGASQALSDQAKVRVCDRWLEWVAEVRLFRKLKKVHGNLEQLWQCERGDKPL